MTVWLRAVAAAYYILLASPTLSGAIEVATAEAGLNPLRRAVAGRKGGLLREVSPQQERHSSPAAALVGTNSSAVAATSSNSNWVSKVVLTKDQMLAYIVYRELPHLRVPSLHVALRELIFIPALVWVAWRSKSKLLLGIVVVQIMTHFLIASTTFQCNPRPWCNLPALIFGLIYIAMAGVSLKGHPTGYFEYRTEALVVLVIGLYIVGSHSVAISTNSGKYSKWLKP
mmetsp:Transcript_30380/g.66553  ORF Transcript_30380/g.66553 Transcript_30380/m.66553 type:complete len:228 (+) Transcript_30380:220-903(+)